MNCHKVRTISPSWHCLLSESVQYSHFPSRFRIKQNMESASFYLRVAQANGWAREGGKQAACDKVETCLQRRACPLVLRRQEDLVRSEAMLSFVNLQLLVSPYSAFFLRQNTTC